MKHKKNIIRLIFGICLILIGLSFVSSATYTDTTSTQFQLTVDYPICSDDGTYFTDYSITPPTIISTTSPNANCYSPSGESCCPAGSNCKTINKINPQGIPIYNCFASEIKNCRDYTNQGDCKNYTKWIAEKSVEGLKANDKFCNNNILSNYQKNNGKSCWDVVAGCQCYWGGNTCEPKFSNKTYCEDEPLPSAESYCEYTITSWVDNCATTGLIDVVWTANPSSAGSECIGGSRQIPCEEITQLGFFNWVNFVLGILVIFIIYGFLMIKKTMCHSTL